MVRRLTAEKTWAMLDTIEIDRGGASYTVDTLRALHARGETDLHLIVGTDMLLSFDKIWRAPDEIARLASLAVCARENEDWDALRKKAAAHQGLGSCNRRLVQGEQPDHFLNRAAAGRCTAMLYTGIGRGLHRRTSSVRLLSLYHAGLTDKYNFGTAHGPFLLVGKAAVLRQEI